MKLVAMMRAPLSSLSSSCIFCQVACSSTATALLHSRRKGGCFSGHKTLCIQALPGNSNTTHSNNKKPSEESRRLSLGKKGCAQLKAILAGQYAVRFLFYPFLPKSPDYSFGFHQSPFNSVNHLHLHCLALPFTPSWKSIIYSPVGPLGGFIEAEKLLERIKPLSFLPS